MPRVKKDVTEIILRSQSLVCSRRRTSRCHVPTQGPGEVTAGDRAAGRRPGPGMHIATLNDKGKLEVELVVERGR